MCGKNNGIKEDDLRTPQGGAVNAATFGWSWRVPDGEAHCTANCEGVCQSCSANQLEDNCVASHWISLRDYLSLQQSPFYLCHEVVCSVVNIFDQF